MKIRNPFLLKTAGLGISLLVRSWIGTIHYQYKPEGTDHTPITTKLKGPFLYTFWHENLLIPAYQYGQRNIHVLISQHADGEMIAEASQNLGFSVVRGSSTRGGIEALKKMVALGKTDHLVITPDGPRGPRREVQPGLVYLAAKTGLPVVCLGLAYSSLRRAKSWDRFALPAPFSDVIMTTTPAFHVPEITSRSQLNEYRLLLQAELDRAEQLAKGHMLAQGRQAA